MKIAYIKITYIKMKDILNDEQICDLVMDCLSFMSEEDFDKIIYENISTDVEVAFMFSIDYITEQFINVLKKHEIFIEATNITDLVLMNKLQNHKLFNDVFSLSNLDQLAIPVLEKFLKENTDINIVLDKINLHGIDSLTEIDKSILELN